MIVEDEDPRSTRIVSVFGTTRRRDRWLLAARCLVLGAFGRVELDLRGVQAPEQVDLQVVAVFGVVSILVPAGADVELAGFNFLAASDSHVEAGNPPHDLPRLRVNATVVFGKVRIRSAAPAPTAAVTAPLADSHTDSPADSPADVADVAA